MYLCAYCVVTDSHGVAAVQQYRQWASLGFVRTAAATGSMRLCLNSPHWTNMLLNVVARGLHQTNNDRQSPSNLAGQLQEQVCVNLFAKCLVREVVERKGHCL